MYFPRHLRGRTRLALFGAFVGLLWSLVPLALVDLWLPKGQALTIVVTGATVGALLSAALAWPLTRWPSLTVLWGLFALLIGAFLFGVLISAVQLGIKDVLGTKYRFASGGTPFHVGLTMVLGLGNYLVGLLLLPLAVWTTYQLKAVIDDNARPQVVRESNTR